MLNPPRLAEVGMTQHARQVLWHYLSDNEYPRVVSFGGPRYTAKTHAGAFCIGLRRFKHPHTKAVAFRRVMKAADLNMAEELKEGFFKPLGFPVGSVRKGEVQWLTNEKQFRFPEPFGGIIQLGFCKDERDLEQHLGVQWDDIWIEQ